MSIYLPIATQDLIFCYYYIIFAISSTLNVIGLIFLLKETPPNQAIIRNYLIVIQVRFSAVKFYYATFIQVFRISCCIKNDKMQVLLLVIDLHLEIGYHPIPLFPALAGYATAAYTVGSICAS